MNTYSSADSNSSLASKKSCSSSELEYEIKTGLFSFGDIGDCPIMDDDIDFTTRIGGTLDDLLELIANSVHSAPYSIPVCISGSE